MAIEKSDDLIVAMARHAAAEDGAHQAVDDGKPRRRAVPGVVVRRRSRIRGVTTEPSGRAHDRTIQNTRINWQCHDSRMQFHANLDHLANIGSVYNIARRLMALRRLMSDEAIFNIWPMGDRSFRSDPLGHMLERNIRRINTLF